MILFIAKAKKANIGEIRSRKDGFMWKKVSNGKWERLAKKINDPEIKIMDAVYNAKKKVLIENNNEIESCYVIDFKGNTILNVQGSKDKIAFSPSEIQKIKKARVFIHNHPCGRSFSIADIIMCVAQEIEEIQAVGEKYTFSFKPNFNNLKKMGLYKPLENEDANKVYSLNTSMHNVENDIVYPEMQSKIMSNEISIEEANATHSHIVMKKFLDKFKGAGEYHVEQT